MEELSTTDAQRELKAKEQEEFYKVCRKRNKIICWDNLRYFVLCQNSKEIEHDDFIEDELIREII